MISGKITWRSPSNIALVKYWGKQAVQMPANPNLSMTLRHAYTEMTVEFNPSGMRKDQATLEFSFEGRAMPEFRQKIAKYLESLIPELPYLGKLAFRISSHNTYPHSAGIASSASSMSALGLCLASIDSHFREKPLPEDEFLRFASRLSRLASGSACRSVYGGYTVWGQVEELSGTSDEYAVPFPFDIHPLFREMKDAILLVSSKKKEISSSAGHTLMETHPYAGARYRMAHSNFLQLVKVLQDGDVTGFIRITEQEALDLQSLMMTSTQPYLLFEPNTIHIVNAIWRFRKATGVPACFTLDAGPNIHLLYPAQFQTEVKDWINSEILQYLENGSWIDDQLGPGPRQILNF